MSDSSETGGLEIGATDPPDLAERVRRRDRSAIAAVVHAYLPQVIRAARGAGLDAQEAEDVAQSTFLSFVETAPRFEGRSRVRTWLFGILFRKISEARRVARRAFDTEDLDAVFERSFDSSGSWVRPPSATDAETYRSEIRAGIDACLETVPVKQRMAFQFRVVEEMDSREVCNILDVTRTHLGVLLHRARTSLRTCLEAKGLGR